MRRLATAVGLTVGPAVLITAIGYLVAQRRPGHLKDAFAGQWDAIFGALTLLTLGLLGLGHGLWLCFSVLGGFQPDNVRRGLLVSVVGIAVGVVGASLLWVILAP
ncbi:hypothetical protein [Jiangella alba]|uniref:Uncharacterized protein n=1 Tax=Jiangella alba TaxID=561176 RepID=A0A1H5PRG2_9ACTN|nr:hypothetical protein [Jiangella alba]SEF16493.1 hypothetical protein SAMN04488561_5402 [Jiangella alba]